MVTNIKYALLRQIETQEVILVTIHLVIQLANSYTFLHNLHCLIYSLREIKLNCNLSLYYLLFLQIRHLFVTISSILMHYIHKLLIFIQNCLRAPSVKHNTLKVKFKYIMYIQCIIQFVRITFYIYYNYHKSRLLEIDLDKD